MNLLKTLPALPLLALLASCGGDADSPGMEYMPDMYRSPAVEAYVDYGQDPYYFADSLVKAQRNTPTARKPAPGTVAFSNDPAKAALNFPYPYPNSNDGYEQAGLELKSPFAMTQATVDEGKVIYDKFCVHCHGATGKGDGAVVTKGNYPVPPAYDGPQLKDLPEGKIFHSLMYGRNVAMGSHAGQLSREERWMVTHYVRFLQSGKLPDAAAPAPTATAAN